MGANGKYKINRSARVLALIAPPVVTHSAIQDSFGKCKLLFIRKKTRQQCRTCVWTVSVEASMEAIDRAGRCTKANRASQARRLTFYVADPACSRSPVMSLVTLSPNWPSSPK